MFRPATKYSEYLEDIRKSIDYILKKVNIKGYTGSFTVQGETWNTTKTIYVKDGIITNVL
jgi:hypothetical protein